MTFFPGDRVRYCYHFNSCFDFCFQCSFYYFVAISCEECLVLFFMSYIGSGILGIVTRRPLVLQLHRIEEGLQDYAEFLHLPKKRFTDFCMFLHAMRI